MAQTQTAGTPAPKPPEAAKPPGDGWDDAGRPDIDGWIKAENGLIVSGKIVGFFAYMAVDPSTKEMREREAVIIAVLQDTKAQKKGGIEVTLKTGQNLAVSMFHGIEGLRPYLSHYQEGKTYVWWQYDKQEPIGGGRKVWKFRSPGPGQTGLKVKGPKGISARATNIVQPASGGEGSSLPSGDDSEIPF